MTILLNTADPHLHQFKEIVGEGGNGRAALYFKYDSHGNILQVSAYELVIVRNQQRLAMRSEGHFDVHFVFRCFRWLVLVALQTNNAPTTPDCQCPLSAVRNVCSVLIGYDHSA